MSAETQVLLQFIAYLLTLFGGIGFAALAALALHHVLRGPANRYNRRRC